MTSCCHSTTFYYTLIPLIQFLAHSAPFSTLSCFAHMFWAWCHHLLEDAHTTLMAILPGAPELTGCRLNSPSPFVMDLCILLEHTKTFHILFNTIPPYLSQTGEGIVGRGKNWSKNLLIGAEVLLPGALPVTNLRWKYYCWGLQVVRYSDHLLFVEFSYKCRDFIPVYIPHARRVHSISWQHR